MWLSRLQHAQDKYREAVKKSEQVVGLEDCLRNLSTACWTDEPPWPPTRAMCEHQFTRRSAVRPPVTLSCSDAGSNGQSSSRESMSPDDRGGDVASRSSNRSKRGRQQTNGGGEEEEEEKASQRSVGSASRGLRKIASGLMEFYRSPPSSLSVVCFKRRRRRRRRLSRSCSHLGLLENGVASPPRGKCHSLQDLVGVDDSGLAMRFE